MFSRIEKNDINIVFTSPSLPLGSKGKKKHLDDTLSNFYENYLREGMDNPNSSQGNEQYNTV